jgi:NhaP-type Na+/H+ or K+/H+ antiporter
MGRISLVRVVLGGLVAGVVINAFEFVLNGYFLASDWRDLMESLHLPQLGMNEVISFIALGFVTGLAAVWTYAAIRPRFGAGPKSAIYAALLTWVTVYFLNNAFPVVSGTETHAIAYTVMIVGVFEIVAATLAGAFFYKDAAPAAK